MKGKWIVASGILLKVSGVLIAIFAGLMTLINLFFDADGYEWQQMEYSDKYGDL